MANSAELQALEEQIALAQRSEAPASTTPPAASAPSETEQKQGAVDSRESGLEQIYAESKTPEPEVEDVPDAVMQDPTALKAWMKDQISRKTTSAITKIRQKEKAKVENYLDSIKPEEIFREPIRPEPVNGPKSKEEILNQYPEDQRKEIDPVIETVRKVAQMEMRPLLEQNAILAAQQRQQLEINHLKEFQEKYKGFSLTPQMFEEAKMIRNSAYDPNIRNLTIAQVIEAKNRSALDDFRIEQRVKQIVERQINGSRPDHPGGSPGKSDLREPTDVDLSKMSTPDFLKYVEKTVGFAPYQ